MSVNFYKRDTCRMCGSRNSENVLPLTPMALCDAYVSQEQLKETQKVYPLDLYMCRDCGYVHIPYVVDPEIIYRDYLYISTSSLGFVKYFQGYASEVLRRVKPPKGTLAVDLGSNDGTLLKFFKNSGMRVLGIEPATQIAAKANKEGIETIADFFNSQLADRIKNDYGQASIITVNNLFANIDNLEDFTRGVSRILTADGVFIIESSYLGDVIEHLLFDTIYHEHLSYLSLKPLIKFLSRFGMELFDVERTSSKGGSLRYYFQFKGAKRKVSPDVARMVACEESLELDKSQTYREYNLKIGRLKEQLTDSLSDLKAKGKTVVGYGASSSCTTLLYHFDLAGLIEYIVDDNAIKHYRFSPGQHLAVLPADVLYERKPDYAVILAWRYAEPIIKRHQAFIKQGGRFIVPLPEIRII